MLCGLKLDSITTHCAWYATVAAAIGVLAAPSSTALAADVESIDWSTVPVNKPRLYYPGQSSYQWLRTPDHKKAAEETKAGEACLRCHEGEQKSLGGILVVENRLEPDPIEDKSGYKRLSVQAAHDDQYLYMRFSWDSDGDGAGDVGNLMRFDGSEWVWWGNHRQHEAVLDEGEPAIYPDRLGIMIGDAKVEFYPEQGCWMTCHDSMVGMEEQADEDDVGEHPVISQLYRQIGIPITNFLVRKYVPGSRSEGTEWAAVKSEDELAALRAQGAFLDLIIWDASMTNPAGVAADFNVLDIKKVDEGTSALWPNGEMRQGPKYMFDEAKVGFSALTEEDLADSSKPKHLIVGQNTVPFDGSKIKEGDLLPAHLLDTGSAEGSAADIDYAKGVFEGGKYTVVMRRKLDTGHPQDDKVLKVGGIYFFGFSIHDDAAGKRAHLVSFPVSVSIGPGKADIQVTTLD